MKAYNPDSTGQMIHGNIFTGPVEINDSLDGWFCRGDLEDWIDAQYNHAEFLSSWEEGRNELLRELREDLGL